MYLPLSSRKLSIVSASILILGSIFFAVLAKFGSNLLDKVEDLEHRAIGTRKAAVGERKPEVCNEDTLAQDETLHAII